MEPGDRLGVYEIVGLLGVGGMGEVYRALDTRLQRPVALKFLPGELSDDPERLARFEREARMLAALNHPNIGAIHGLEEHGGHLFLVLELVEGESLERRIEAGDLQAKERLEIARTLARALEAAHERGIVHRDLKPGNVMITPEGVVKVLDFGLAKSSEPIEQDATSIRTRDLATRAGTVFGTIPYMSPEQARGKPVDRRTDIWAFGCVLYEMLTGKRAFPGETAADTLSAVIRGEPDWGAIPDDVEPAVVELTRRCLVKDPRHRLRGIGTAELIVDDVLAGRTGTAGARPDRPRSTPLRRPLLLVAALAIVALGITAVAGLSRPRHPEASPRLLSISLPADAALARSRGVRPNLTLSPDGTRLAYVGDGAGGSRLYLREMSSLEVTPFPGTADAQLPFFSPDGDWLGFFADGHLKKVAVAGGEPQTLVPAPSPWGGTWLPDGRIVFTPFDHTGLWEVPERGGEARQLTTPDAEAGYHSHDFPYVTPDGEGVLFTSFGVASTRLAHLDLDSGEIHELLDDATLGQLVGSRLVYGLFGQGRTIWSQGFDAGNVALQGRPRRLVDDALTDAVGQAPVFAASAAGVVVYGVGTRASLDRRLVWVAEDGSSTAITAEQRTYLEPSLSPDGTRIATIVRTPTCGCVWVYDVDRGTFSQITTEHFATQPRWSPDGTELAFSTNLRGVVEVFRAPSDASGPPVPLRGAPRAQTLNDWSPDGAHVLVRQLDPDRGDDIYLVPLDAAAEPEPLVNGPANEHSGTFSPDGRWIAFVSEQSGRPEVYARPFPGPGPTLTLSTAGGAEPRWAADGLTVYYRRGTAMMAVDVDPGAPGLAPGRPRRLFDADYLQGRGNYDVAGAGRFLMVEGEANRTALRRLDVLLDPAPGDDEG